MIVSKNLIGNFLPKIYDVTMQQFIDACGTIGIEVENIHYHPKTNNLVIGEILKIEKHPNAEKLNVCEVKIDNQNAIHHIVCGAPNVKINKKVIVALQGTKLHDGRVIEYKELRGVLSQGMLCAYSELTPHHQFQMDEDKDGIILLDEATIGDTDITKYVGLDDVMFDLSVPSNRNDLNAVLFLCKELSGYFKWTFEIPNLQGTYKGFQENFTLSYDPNLANGIAVIKIKGITNQESPWKLKSLLMNNGVKPLNEVLDKLAYITLLTNVSTACYDANKIGQNLQVANATGEETFVGLNGKSYKLSSGDIVIKSNDKIICLGGILGAKEYGISDTTRDIVIEIANFSYARIRRTALKLDITTDAAKRFGKPFAIFLNQLAIQEVYHEFANNQISEPIIKFEPQQDLVLDVDFNYVRQLIGVNITDGVIKENLRYFNFQFEGQKCKVPKNRIDVLTSQDVSEEVLKFLNINDLPMQPILGQINVLYDNIEDSLFSRIKSLLLNNYFSEVKTYNLTSEQDLNLMNLFNINKPIKIENGNNVNRQYLRLELLNKMLSTFQYNHSYKTRLQPIFEIQNIYYESNKSICNLTLLCPNKIDIDQISGSKIVMNVNTLKSICNGVANLFNSKVEYFTSANVDCFYNNELLAIQCGGQVIGYVGAIKKSTLKKYDLENNEIYCLTINLDIFFKLYNKTVPQFQSVNNLMPIYKDISFTINRLEKIVNLLNALDNLNFINSYEFIDRYDLDNDNIAYTLRFRFSNTKGLKTQEIDTYLKEIEKQIIENHAFVRK